MRANGLLKLTGLLFAVCPIASNAADPATQPTATATASESELAFWPQWRGPARNGLSPETGLMSSWPATGPELLWKTDQAGLGFSSVAVVGDRLYSLGRQDQQTVAYCLDANTGQSIWTQPIANVVADEYLTGWGTGTRGTPTIDGDRVYVLADLGQFTCLDRHSGKILWEHHLVKDFGGTIPKWGYSESPLIDGALVLVTPGNRTFVVGFDKTTGAVKYRTEGINDTAQYVSLQKMTVGAVPMYVTATGKGLLGIDAKTGKLLWRHDKTGNHIAVIPDPVVVDNYVYHSSNYDAGCTLLELSAQGEQINVKEIYYNKEMMNHHGGYILLENTIYGFSKGKGWIAQDLQTGKLLWNHQSRKNSSGAIVFADGRLYCYGDGNGVIELVQPSREKWNAVSEFQIPEKTSKPRGSNNQGKIWNHPVIANGKLYLRDQEWLFCFNIQASN